MCIWFFFTSGGTFHSSNVHDKRVKVRKREQESAYGDNVQSYGVARIEVAGMKQASLTPYKYETKTSIASFQMKCSHEDRVLRPIESENFSIRNSLLFVHCIFNAFFPFGFYWNSLKMKMVYISWQNLWCVTASYGVQCPLQFSIRIIANGVKCMDPCGFLVCEIRKHKAEKKGQCINQSVLTNKRVVGHCPANEKLYQRWYD